MTEEELKGCLTGIAADASLGGFARSLAEVLNGAFFGDGLPLADLRAMKVCIRSGAAARRRADVAVLREELLAWGLERMLWGLPRSNYDLATASKRWALDMLKHIDRVIDGTPAGKAMLDISIALAEQPEVALRRLQDYRQGRGDPNSRIAKGMRDIADEFRVIIDWGLKD